MKVTVKVAWWLRLYVYGVMLTAWITGMRPDEEKLRYWFRRALIVWIE